MDSGAIFLLGNDLPLTLTSTMPLSLKGRRWRPPKGTIFCPIAASFCSRLDGFMVTQRGCSTLLHAGFLEIWEARCQCQQRYLSTGMGRRRGWEKGSQWVGEVTPEQTTYSFIDPWVY